jgi:hypothetical protein
MVCKCLAAEGGKKQRPEYRRPKAEKRRDVPSGLSRAVVRSFQTPLFHDVGKYDSRFVDYLKTCLSLYRCWKRRASSEAKRALTRGGALGGPAKRRSRTTAKPHIGD